MDEGLSWIYGEREYSREEGRRRFSGISHTSRPGNCTSCELDQPQQVRETGTRPKYSSWCLHLSTTTLFYHPPHPSLPPSLLLSLVTSEGVGGENRVRGYLTPVCVFSASQNQTCFYLTHFIYPHSFNIHT